MHAPRPSRAVVQADKNTRIKVRQKSPLFIEAEFMFSTYTTSFHHSGLKATINMTAKATTLAKTYPATLKFAEFAIMYNRYIFGIR